MAPCGPPWPLWPPVAPVAPRGPRGWPVGIFCSSAFFKHLKPKANSDAGGGAGSPAVTKLTKWLGFFGVGDVA